MLIKKLPLHWLFLAVPGLLVLLLYLPVVGHGFVWDDPLFLRESPLYRDPALWTEALRRPFVLSPNYFRPLALLTFMVELRLVGLHPTLFHLTNLALHLLNTTLIALLARSLSRPTDTPEQVHWLPALGAGLLYGLHPALLEGVAFISSRFDLLMTSFLLLAILAETRLRRPLARYAAVGGAFLLAALAKEMAIAFILALPLWHLAKQRVSVSAIQRFGALVKGKAARSLLHRSTVAETLGVYAAVFVAGLAYLALRYASLGYILLPESGNPLPVGNALQHLLLVGRSLAEYVRLVVWPFTTLSPIHYSPLPIPLNDFAAWLSLGAALLLVVVLIRWVKFAPGAGWLAIAGVFSVLPVLNILPLELGGGSFAAERFLVFPLAFFTLAAVMSLEHELSGITPKIDSAHAFSMTFSVSRRQCIILTAGLLWLFVSSAALQLNLPHWRDDLTLWTWAARRAPRSGTPPTNLALQHINQRDYATGLALARHALQLEPANANAWNNAGLALFHQERYAEAQQAFEQAVMLEPHNALLWNNLAGALREQDQLAEAEQVLLDKVLNLDAALPVAYLNLGLLYLRADRPDLASSHLEEAARLLPPDQTATVDDLLAQTREPERWLRLGDLLIANHQIEGALRAFEQAGMFGANLTDVVIGQSAAFMESGAWSQAGEVLQTALQQSPDDARLHNNLGVVAREQGDLEAARQHFSRAVELASEWELPRQNLAALENTP